LTRWHEGSLRSVLFALVALLSTLPFLYERLAGALAPHARFIALLTALSALAFTLFKLAQKLSTARFEVLCATLYLITIDSGFELSKGLIKGLKGGTLPVRLLAMWGAYYVFVFMWLTLASCLSARPRRLATLVSAGALPYLALTCYVPPLQDSTQETTPQALKGRAVRGEQALRDVYVVVFDALRGDAMEFVRRLEPPAPPLKGFEALAERAVSFERAHSTSIATHTSLPGLLDLKGYQTSARAWPLLNHKRWTDSLPGRLQGLGYETHLLTDYPNLTLRGMDALLWDHTSDVRGRHMRLFNLFGDAHAALTHRRALLKAQRGGVAVSRSGEPLLARFERLIRGEMGEMDEGEVRAPRFVTLHLGVPHQPYAYPPYQPSALPEFDLEFNPDEANEAFLAHFNKPTPSELQTFKRHYSYALHAADEALARVVRLFEEHADPQRDLLVITADHGEHFGEHSVARLAHGGHLYEVSHHVPLMLFGAGLSPQRVKADVSNGQLAPTLYGLLGVTPASQESNKGGQGESLLRVAQRTTLSASRSGDILFNTPFEGSDVRVELKGRGGMYQLGAWRMILTTHPRLLGRPEWAHTSLIELYDLRSDPHEEHNLAEEHPEMIERIARHFKLKLPSAE
jgi:arylsulfatase A-like enzyme